MSARAPLTIAIADDHAVVREGLRLLLESEGLSIVGEASDVDQTLALVRERRPMILLLDLHLGRRLSLGILSKLGSASPGTRTVILTVDDDPTFAQQAWAAGAMGYVLKEVPGAELMRAIRTVAGGGRYLDPSIGGVALAGGGDAILSERELEVLRLLALGHTNTEIARILFVSPRTVETHRANLQRKLGISGRPELVQYALERGVIRG